MTYRETLDTILEFAGQSAGGDFEAHVKRLTNGVYREVLESGAVPHERRVFTLTSVASTSQYGMPLYVRRVLGIVDPTTPQFVFETTARAYDLYHPGTTDSSTPQKAYSLGVRGVQAYPASDSTITVVSDSALDTGTNYKVRIIGFNSSGVLVTELLTVTGLTAVTSSNTYDSTLGIERIVKAPASGYTFAGNLTIKDTTASLTTLAVIPVWWDSPDYEWIEFYPIPGAAISYEIRAEMRKPDLINGTDWPEFDREYHMLLPFGVCKDLLPALGKTTSGDRCAAAYKELFKKFKRAYGTRPAALYSFAAVQMVAGPSQRPGRPLIKGVDFGLAS